MAGTLSLNVNARGTNGGFTDQFTVSGLSITISGTPVASGVVSIGTTEEALDVADVSTNGWLLMKNLDGANYVQFGPEDSGAMVVDGRMKAGEPALYRLDPVTTLRLKANTAACQVQFILYSD